MRAIARERAVAGIQRDVVGVRPDVRPLPVRAFRLHGGDRHGLGLVARHVRRRGRGDRHGASAATATARMIFFTP